MRHKHINIGKNIRGISLAEVVISTLLVGLILVSALASVGASTRSWIATSELADGGTIARQLLLEITPLAYEDPNQTPGFGIETGELSGTIRTNFDDIDDYKDFTDTPPRNRAGTALANYAGWQRTADVTKLKQGDKHTKNDGDNDEGLRLITVTVTSPKGKITTLSTYRSNVGGTLQKQGVSETVVTWVGCDLQAGNAPTVSAAVSSLNHATDQ